MVFFDYGRHIDDILDRLKQDGSYRYFNVLERHAGLFPKATIRIDSVTSRQVVNWCSNDYLGMGQHPILIEAACKASRDLGVGSGGTRNISGSSIYHHELELALSSYYGKSGALIFTSGYSSNHATIGALARALPGCVLLSDANNHASLIDGIRHSSKSKIIFRHNDVEHLDQLLCSLDSSIPKIVVFESIYSMEGDFSPLRDLIITAKKHGSLVYLDEVHAVGVFGNRGCGLSEAFDLAAEVDIIEGTFAKGYGVSGGFIVANSNIVDFVRSHASSFIFTTSVPPSVAASCLASLHHLCNSDVERLALWSNVRYFKQKLRMAKLPLLENNSHIFPIMVKDAKQCLEISRVLRDEFAIYVQAINYPTVPRGLERLRFTVTATHSKDLIDDCVRVLSEVFARHGLI